MKPDDKIPSRLLPPGFIEQKFAVPAEIVQKGHTTAVRMGDAESGITIIMIEGAPVMFRSGLILYIGSVMRDLFNDDPKAFENMIEGINAAVGIAVQIEWLDYNPFFDRLESELDLVIDRFGTQVDGDSSITPLIKPDPNLPPS